MSNQPDDLQPFGLVVGNAFAGHAFRANGNERKAAKYDNALTDLVNIAIARARIEYAANQSRQITLDTTPPDVLP